MLPFIYSLYDSDALSDYLEGKTPVGVMGGHRLSRVSKEYRDLVFLCRKLALQGFLIGKKRILELI
jgi:hypothetical protein